MIGTILIAAGITFLVIISIKELLSLKNLRYYSAQGIRTIYKPMIGYASLFSEAEKNDQSSEIVNLVKYAIKNKEDVVVFNAPDHSNGFIWLLSPKVMKEFFAKEFKFTKKTTLIDNFKAGFIDGSSEKDFKNRALFKEFFDFKNIISLIPQLHKIMDNFFDRLISSNWGNGENSFKTVNMEVEFNEMFSDIVELILFNDPNSKNIKINGMRISEAISKSGMSHLNEMFSVGNALTLGMMTRLGIGYYSREGQIIRKQLSETIIDIYETRKKAGRRSKINLIDLIIKDDARQPEKNKWTEEEIVSHFILFELAGTDTTKNLSCNIILHLAKHPEVLTLFRETFNDIKKEKGTEFKLEDLMED